ncbi:MAG: nucleotidyl transferase AbiEii/AbiGii toxin family protein [Acidobacteria bacterium]|nr:nucleotidyl transferase AbiEii/AbiGii toxin family protein [Acidobacteriota bacterium]
MKLCEHPDFEQAIIQAVEHFRPEGLRAAIIEKDYYVTEALRSIATASAAKAAAGTRENSTGNISNTIIFKGGTSLSKGWNLIARFSEDIDIFLDPLAFDPPLGKRAIDRELKVLRDAVAAHSALAFVEGESQTIGGFGRNDRFAYDQRFGGPGEVAARVLLEAGTASGREPTTVVAISSYLSQFLRASRVSLGTDDEDSFSMRLLHFRRTFVEKMFAIHGKVELLKRDGQPLGAYARHYYDLFQLAAQSEVIDMLQSAEYDEIKSDYDRISRAHFDRSYFFPKDMRFAESEALFPPPEIEPALKSGYDAQCRLLCHASFPPWASVKSRFLELRHLL